jgi:hypothetical protein
MFSSGPALRDVAEPIDWQQAPRPIPEQADHDQGAVAR